SLELDRLLEVGERDLRRVRSALDAVVGVEDVHDPYGVLVGPTARITCCLDRSADRTVVGAVAGKDFRTAGDSTRDLDRVLVGVGSAEREEDLVDVARQELGQL